MTKETTGKSHPVSPAQAMRQRIVKRVAMEFRDGMYGILLWKFISAVGLEYLLIKFFISAHFLVS